MHLDCVFSILGDDCCLMLKEMMGRDSPTCRLVDEYTQDVVSGAWSRSRERVEFASYMRDNGFHIIEIEGADQLVRGWTGLRDPCCGTGVPDPGCGAVLPRTSLCSATDLAEAACQA